MNKPSVLLFKSHILATLFTLLLVGCNKHSGVITNNSGEGIPGAMIYLADESGKVSSTVSNEKGEYEFENLPKGAHWITVGAESHTRVTKRVPSHLTEVNFQLSIDPVPTDSDGDGLTDVEETQFGTDPQNPDTDGDSLSDQFETTVGASFSAIPLGIKALKKDILLEIDWTEANPNTKITRHAINLIQNSFARAPIENPDGSTGINLIVDDGRFGGGTAINVPGEWIVKEDDESLINIHLAEERRPYFYHSYSASSLTADSRDIAGYGYSLKRLNFIEGDYSHLGPAESFAEAVLLQHELGHNLFLQHGGTDLIHCKPNYPSVMNYNPFMALVLDYSHGQLPSLDENELYEEDGIGFGALDWNGDFQISTDPVAAEINAQVPNIMAQRFIDVLDSPNINILKQLFNLDSLCDDEELQVLNDHDDWNLINEKLGRYLDINSTVNVKVSAVKSNDADNPAEMDAGWNIPEELLQGLANEMSF